MLATTCPGCNTQLQLPETDAGKAVLCPSCGESFKAPPAPAAADAITAQAIPPSAPVATGITPEQPRPARAGAKRDDFADGVDDLPRRRDQSNTGLIAGMSAGMIVLIVVGVGACLVVPCLIALLLPAVQKVREAAARTQSMNNLKQIAIAVHSHHDVFKTLPPPKHVNNGQAVELSWRVSILPFIEQAALFQQFDQTSGWDSPRNQPLQNMGIVVYQSPRFDPTLGQTRYQYFTGPGTLFADNRQVNMMAGIPDGTSNTFLAAEALTPVPWTKPADIVVQPNQPLPLPEQFLVVMVDGSVRMVNRRQVGEATLRNLINPNDGIALPQNWEAGAP